MRCLPVLHRRLLKSVFPILHLEPHCKLHFISYPTSRFCPCPTTQPSPPLPLPVPLAVPRPPLAPPRHLPHPPDQRPPPVVQCPTKTVQPIWVSTLFSVSPYVQASHAMALCTLCFKRAPMGFENAATGRVGAVPADGRGRPAAAVPCPTTQLGRHRKGPAALRPARFCAPPGSIRGPCGSRLHVRALLPMHAPRTRAVRLLAGRPHKVSIPGVAEFCPAQQHLM